MEEGSSVDPKDQIFVVSLENREIFRTEPSQHIVM
jgi:hypothetical protein